MFHGNAIIDGLNRFNLLLKDDYDNDALTEYLNLEELQLHIGIHPRMKWEQNTHGYHAPLEANGDSVENSALLLTEALNDGIRGLIYAGDCDFVCNWIGNEAWTEELEWKGKESYNAAERVEWEVNGVSVGEIRQGRDTGFTFLRVYNAGHLV